MAKDALLLLAKVGRCLPSRALDYTRDLVERHSSGPTAIPLNSQSIRTLAAKLWHVDELGLVDLDYLYLQALESGPRGLPALQQLLPISAEEIAMDVEPYLIDIGAVHLSQRGRALTAYGESLIHRHRSEQSERRLENEKV
jgi:Holliday junction resolvasome RuvABC ATP-dependent DNA helicase subunit